MGLIARVTSNGKATSCTRRSRVTTLLTFMMQFHAVLITFLAAVLEKLAVAVIRTCGRQAVIARH